MKTFAKRFLLWLYVRGVLRLERVDACFRRHPWLRNIR
jgi:hypothetical protein